MHIISAIVSRVCSVTNNMSLSILSSRRHRLGHTSAPRSPQPSSAGPCQAGARLLESQPWKAQIVNTTSHNVTQPQFFQQQPWSLRMDRNGENNLIVVYFLLLPSVVEKFYHHIKLMSSTLHAILKFSSIFSYNNIAVLWWELVSSPALCSLSCWVGDTTTHGEEAAMSRAGQGNILIGPLPASLQRFVVGFIYHMVLLTFFCSWMWCIIVCSRFLKIF